MNSFYKLLLTGLILLGASQLHAGLFTYISRAAFNMAATFKQQVFGKVGQIRRTYAPHYAHLRTYANPCTQSLSQAVNIYMQSSNNKKRQVNSSGRSNTYGFGHFFQMPQYK